ncbi:tyrosine-type recombinase/integrase [Serratia fonticola]|uniref:tyrosine-type recombinase/integrase n=1 Tax=Serratia fonticola TaxID=47917 RepID=UPI0013774A8D|nr:site-specific integrase [Serratia fonticola]NCG50094.1 tyrosine-type recombinase/integrase [Serratia fonticola]
MRKTFSFDELLEVYFFTRTLREATRWSYEKNVRTFLAFNNVKPAQVTEEMVLSWKEQVLGVQQLATRTWNSKVRHLQALMNFAIARKLVPQKQNPFNGALVKEGKKRKKTITNTHINRTLTRLKLLCEEEAAGKMPLYGRPNALQPCWFWMAVIQLLDTTGIRLNQLLHIRLMDVKLDDGIIELESNGCKNHNEHRVPIIEELRPWLVRLLDESRQRHALPDAQLFNVGRFVPRLRDKYPEKMTEAPLRSFFRRLSKMMNYTATPHRFRHTVATNLMKSPDRNIKHVQNLLGHSSLQSTMEYIEDDTAFLGDVMQEEIQRRRGSK